MACRPLQPCVKRVWDLLRLGTLWLSRSALGSCLVSSTKLVSVGRWHPSASDCFGRRQRTSGHMDGSALPQFQFTLSSLVHSQVTHATQGTSAALRCSCLNRLSRTTTWEEGSFLPRHPSPPAKNQRTRAAAHERMFDQRRNQALDAGLQNAGNILHSEFLPSSPPLRQTPQHFARFYPSPATIFILSFSGLCVAFWWCLKRRDPEMHVWVRRSSESSRHRESASRGKEPNWSGRADKPAAARAVSEQQAASPVWPTFISCSSTSLAPPPAARCGGGPPPGLQTTTRELQTRTF